MRSFLHINGTVYINLDKEDTNMAKASGYKTGQKYKFVSTKNQKNGKVYDMVPVSGESGGAGVYSL